ncbi:MAG: 4-hydroxythreonine-4-phosphate dehydrogenase PdxA [Merismopedia sp. SIO2A8]|nr:4-hydroxythreonine-4-phosphate dehydrogenase PdxA [Symploca sp. SIO2B6]NET51203.1 4-hydroxythreonine-4-phosphate dehydrogenase PdxA [Merismopedia sp. SIO2A8]
MTISAIPTVNATVTASTSSPMANPVASRPQLALSLGDPAGIGPEIILKVLADPSLHQQAEITVVGDRPLLHDTYTTLMNQYSTLVLADPDQLAIIDIGMDDAIRSQVTIGQGNSASGEISFRSMETAIAHTLQGQFQGIVTAPIAKSAWKAAGHEYPGQTELLAEKAGMEQFGMLFVARSPHANWTLRTLLATTHIPLAQVPTTLTPELMTRKLALLVHTLAHDFGITSPRIAIPGLNPHSGEQGQLGHEEQEWLIPWMNEMRSRFPHVQLDGPVPPDTLWVRPGQVWYGTAAPEQGHDAYLALYHDQGLIPVKLMGFDRAVNTTIGLPFIRTSPDHGTAFDIAGQGKADATSLGAAIELAIELALQRQLRA